MMISVDVRFFATLRDRSGEKQTLVSLERDSTVADLLDEIATMYPATKESLPTALVAINHEYAFPEDTLTDGDEIALFPPVSGGAGDAPWTTIAAIISDDFDLNDIQRRITTKHTGAVCIFSGAVRGVTDPDRGHAETQSLHYEAYEPMAEKKLLQVADEIRERWPLVQGIAVIQRVGQLEIGDTTVLVACASGHRDEGCFEGARFGIDRLKEIVPVWKKERGPDGSEWVEGRYFPTKDDVRAAD